MVRIMNPLSTMDICTRFKQQAIQLLTSSACSDVVGAWLKKKHTRTHRFKAFIRHLTH